ncbi:MAG TPA: type I DNA topoisomerase [Gammaproteobacteria bacterium]|nr:type I DNA topoisomerase [Gammaproteobacteria bacterium]|tara:strand:- start:9097 stop:11562 length:2466 start_codon:yes stop_codon:yes gene_type:complete
MSKLVIVESPAKAKTIQKYLGDGYAVLPTIGHIRELPKKDAIDPDNGYSMKYVVSPGKENAVKEIKGKAKNAEQVILATDPDREGEAIAWHVADIIANAKFEQPDIKRAVFYEISEKAVKEAVNNPGEIAMDLVQSQETRRAVDRHFGFSLSPLLWRLFPSNNHSAGRVQSPALRMIVEREREIEAFVPQEYWTVSARLEKDGEYEAKLSIYKQEPVKKFTFDSTALVEGLSAELEDQCQAGLVAKSITKKAIKRSPREPFRTSVLQQQASNKFGFTPKRTMQIAQSLYAREGGGLITYIRTDSIEIDQGKLPSVRAQVVSMYGEVYLQPRNYKNKKEAKNIQEAHGAITPVDISLIPSEAKKTLQEDEFKLYELIWRRTVASQMKDATFERTSIEFVPMGDESLATFSFSDQELVFSGYLEATQEEVTDNKPPPINENDAIGFKGLIKAQHFTDPPPRYNDASMIKALEEKGIGRPSTYADILSKLTDRKYVWLKQKRYEPSDMGRLVSNFLNERFGGYISDEFTSNMENNLDEISSGKKSKQDILNDFWSPLIEAVDEVSDGVTRRDVNPQRPLGNHPETGRPVFARMTKNGPAIQVGDMEKDETLEWATIKEGQSLFSINLEEACILLNKPSENVLGYHPETNEPVIVREARYGPTVQLGSKEDGNKPRYVGMLKTDSVEAMTFERAMDYLGLPKELGVDPESGEKVVVTIGPYGPYFKRGSKNFRGRKGLDPFSVELEEALLSISSSKGSGALKTFDDSSIKIVDGRWGAYVTDGKKNASIPKDKEPESLELQDCLDLLEKAPAKKKGKKKSKKATT